MHQGKITHVLSTVVPIFIFGLRAPQAMAHCFNGSFKAPQLTLIHRSRLGTR